MKRELKGNLFDLPKLVGKVTKPIPMKRELKGNSISGNTGVVSSHKANPDEKGTERSHRRETGPSRTQFVTKPIPMKRELKELCMCISDYAVRAVTKPIPMKRELKAFRSASPWASSARSHKANPDKKGTESQRKKSTTARMWASQSQSR